MQEKRTDYVPLLIAVIVVFIVFFLLFLIKIPISDQQTATELRPFVVLDYYTAQEKDIDSRCVTRNFSYSYSWEGWITENPDYTTPYLELINYENETGTYIVQFAFFDSSIYPYSIYKDTITWNDATMYSIEENITLEALGSKMITIPTAKLDRDATYWAIGDIKAPVIADCGKNVKYKTVIKNQTITQFRTVEKYDLVTKKISVWQYLFGSN